jgi:hypothetical protein
MTGQAACGLHRCVDKHRQQHRIWHENHSAKHSETDLHLTSSPANLLKCILHLAAGQVCNHLALIYSALPSCRQQRHAYGPELHKKGCTRHGQHIGLSWQQAQITQHTTASPTTLMHTPCQHQGNVLQKHVKRCQLLKTHCRQHVPSTRLSFAANSA